MKVNSYQKIGWLDHVEDVETGEVIQEGTPVSQTNMNHMDDGIFENREAVILHEAQIAAYSGTFSASFAQYVKGVENSRTTSSSL